MALACRRFSPFCCFLRISSANYSYKSIYNLENLYPNSPYNYGGVSQEHSDSPTGKYSGEVPIHKVDVKYSRASGPGGQHVNKTSSKAEVRFHVESADWIPEDLKPKILEKYKKRINKAGELIVTADDSRYQMMNLRSCLNKIKDFIYEVEKPPDPKKQEEMERMMDADKIHAAHRKRLQRKRIDGYTKAMRKNFD